MKSMIWLCSTWNYVMNEEQLQSTREFFDSFDKDQSGEVTLDEIRQIVGDVEKKFGGIH